MKKAAQAQRFFVSGVCCATEEVLLRRKLDGMIGVDGYQYRALTGELILGRHVSEIALKSELHNAGFGLRSGQDLHGKESFTIRHRDSISIGIAGLLAATGILLAHAGGAELVWRFLLLAAIALAGRNVFLKAWKAARSGALDMNVLMAMAVLGALAINEWAEGAAVLILFGLSLVLENYSRSKTRQAVRSLMATAPDETTVIRDGREFVVRSDTVRPGELFRIRPGERIALDGRVVEGSSRVNEAAVSGESAPVPKQTGSLIYAGSLNESGSLKAEVTKAYEQSQLAHMVHLVEEAEENRAPSQLFVERFARIYTPLVLALAILTSILPPLAMGEPFSLWFYRALVLLVIACPCALVISTPITIVSAITNAARRGVLVKGGLHLEGLSRIRAIAFDKTGTLTEGKPVVTDVIPLDGLAENRLIQIAAALEFHSEHHLAASILREAERRGVPYAIQVEHFRSVPGIGVHGLIEGKAYFVGAPAHAMTQGALTAEAAAALRPLAEAGKTGIIVAQGDSVQGIIAVAEAARHGIREVISALREEGVSDLILLSGDNREAVRRIADGLGIDNAEAGRLPQEKVAVVEALRRRYGAVAMVGDGVNDAPALASATVGIAMGVSGSDTALDTADVVLLSDDLSKLPGLLRLSRKALRVVKQNIVIALVIKGAFVALSLAGFATLWMAILADDGAALLVILNGLRLLREGRNSQASRR